MIAHVIQFMVLSLIASLVYHALRQDCLRTAILTGLRRFASFMVIALLFGILLQLVTRWV